MLIVCLTGSPLGPCSLGCRPGGFRVASETNPSEARIC